MRHITEEHTRKELNNPQFERADWYLHAGQGIFLQKRHLETADTSTLPSVAVQRLYEPPLDMFGADAVERWFTEKGIEEVVKFVSRLKVSSNEN